MLHTGLRETEVRTLEWSDVDWDRALIKVQRKEVTELRRVSIPDVALVILRDHVQHKAPDQPLFRNVSELGKLKVRLAIRSEQELLALKVADVNLSQRTITSTRTYTWQPKATQGDVPMCRKVKDLLRRLQDSSTSNFIFAHHDGGSCRLRLLDMLKQAQRQAEISGNLRIHDLRHTFAVRLRELGTPLETIMGILRHADIRETLIYAPYLVHEGMKAVAKLDD